MTHSHSQNPALQRLKYTAAFFLPLLFLILVLLYTFYRQEIATERKIVSQHVTHTVNLQASRFTGEFASIITDLLFFSEYQQTLDMLEDAPDSRMRLTNDLALFSRGSGKFDQIRILNVTGMETLRVNLVKGESVAVPEKDLQYKGKRYYFRDTIELDKGKVFVSPFDLNMEHGAIEKPLKPTIRFGTPIFDRTDALGGAVLFNYLGARLIEELKQLSSKSPGHYMLLNNEGYWISGIRPEDEWGFMFKEGKNLTMGNRFPEAWRKVASSDSGQFKDENGLFTFTTVYPIPADMMPGKQEIPDGSGKKASSAPQYSWKLVSYLSAEYIGRMEGSLRSKYVYIALFTAVTLLVVTWLLASVRVKKNAAQRELAERTEELASANKDLQFEIGERLKAEAALRLSHEQLEHKVKERTAELSVLNQNLRSEVAERKRAEAELSLAKDAAEAASRAKSDFLRNVGHELRTPMNHIMGFTDLVLGTQLTNDQKEKLQKVRSSAGGLLKIITDIIDFTGMDKGALTVDVVDFLLNQALQELMKAHERKALDKGLRFKLDISPDTPLALRGDPTLLTRILGHLIDNAIKFTESGSVDLKVEPERSSPGPESRRVLLFSVTDTGIGIPSDLLPKLFGSFTQADPSEERKYGGTGIGLALILKMANLMAGEIQVESQEGVGSTFLFRVPFEVGETAALSHLEDVPPEALEGPSPSDADSEKAPGPGGDRAPDKAELLLAALEKMEEPLRKRLAKGSKATIADVLKLSWPANLQDQIKNLAKLVAGYRFKNALELVEEIQAVLRQGGS